MEEYTLIEWLKELYEINDYRWDHKNIIGIRNPKKQSEDIFNDKLILVSDTGYEKFKITTDPGKYWTANATKEWGVAGAAHLVEGFYKDTYKLGNHMGETALVQRGTEVSVWRDVDKNYEYDKNEDVVESGWFGINIHYSKWDPKYIGRWSAGCQVFQIRSEWEYFLNKIKAENKSWWSYLLIKAEDLPDYLRKELDV